MKIAEPIVYIIEDNPTLCNTIKGLLISIKIETVIYRSGEAYLESYDPTLPGCLLINIPIIDGIELLAELNKRCNRMPIIFIAGHEDIPMAIRAMKEGAFDFILKPFAGEALLEKVQKAIALDKKRQDIFNDSLY